MPQSALRIRLPDGTIAPRETVFDVEIERDIVSDWSHPLIHGKKPLESGTVTWKEGHPQAFSQYQCHFRALHPEPEFGYQYSPEYDSDVRPLIISCT